MPADPEIHINDGAGTPWSINQLPTDTALLRRIAYNTDVTRRILIVTLVVVPLIVLVLGIIGLVMLNSLTPTTSLGGY